MPFDLNASGAISLTSLVSYQVAAAADEWCILRLVLANPGETPQTASVVIQASVSFDLATEFATDLQKTIDHIRHAKARERPQ